MLKCLNLRKEKVRATWQQVFCGQGVSISRVHKMLSASAYIQLLVIVVASDQALSQSHYTRYIV